MYRIIKLDGTELGMTDSVLYIKQCFYQGGGSHERRRKNLALFEICWSE